MNHGNENRLPAMLANNFRIEIGKCCEAMKTSLYSITFNCSKSFTKQNININ
jgi:hypothetical protein